MCKKTLCGGYHSFIGKYSNVDVKPINHIKICCIIRNFNKKSKKVSCKRQKEKGQNNTFLTGNVYLKLFVKIKQCLKDILKILE